MSANALRWNGAPGHYEVYYLTVTEPRTGVGLWIRYTLLAPDAGPPTCALWFVAMDRDGFRTAHTETLPIEALQSAEDPFRLAIGRAELRNDGMNGALADCAWDLRWERTGPPVQPVHPLLVRTGVARTILTLPDPHVRVSGTVRIGERDLVLDAVGGGQAHLWGRAHAARWAWGHCSDFAGRPDDWVDAVSVFLPRFGRELGPTTPVVGCIDGEPFAATDPLRVVRTWSRFGLTDWQFAARDGHRRLVATVSAPRASLVGVTYHDPDGAPAYCYNSEVATMHLDVMHREGRRWRQTDTLYSDGRAHFEYGQRAPVPGASVLIG
ncbi:MAG: hypothetical protein ABI950_05605 [Solirubrobacteraceae bacterium]